MTIPADAAKAMIGHLLVPGRASEIQDAVRERKIVRKLIPSGMMLTLTVEKTERG